MLLRALLQEALTSNPSYPSTFTATVLVPVSLSALAERIGSAQTSTSHIRHTSTNVPSPRVIPSNRAPPVWPLQDLKRSSRYGYSTAACTAMQQQPFQGQGQQQQPSNLEPEAFQGGAADQGELLVEESAIKRLQQLSAKQGGKPVLLRVEVEGGGCSGFQYKFALVDSINPDDKVFGRGGSKVLCDTLSLQFLRGAKVEFEDSLMRSAFVITANPNADKSMSCGCGSSFSVK